jgi:hypothetical protein
VRVGLLSGCCGMLGKVIIFYNCFLGKIKALKGDVMMREY